jgi:hypothetical protein
VTTKTRASAKKPALDDVLQVLAKLYGSPVYSDREDDPLIDHLLVGVLGCHVEPAEARAGVGALSEAFLDLNEARSSPLGEIEEVLAPHIPAEKRRAACGALRMALQDVWDGTHGLDLEPLRGRDPADQRAFLEDLPNTEGGPAALVFQIALGEGALAFGPREEHLLARFGLLPRSSSAQRLRQAMERKIPVAERMRFTWLAGFGSHLCEEDWDLAHPFCKLLITAKAKEVVERERAEKRAEQQRKQEERLRQQEEARRLREEEKARKARERQEQKQAAAEARKEAARKKAEEKRKAEARKQEAARKQAEALKKRAAAAKKKAEAAKAKAAAKKKADALKKKADVLKKKAAAKKKADALKKKAAAKKKADALKKKAAAKKKTAPKKKTAAKKKTAGRKTPTARKKTAAKRKTAARKKPATPKKKAAARPRKTSARARKK